jgi:two-component system cell cycle sensor histidine kinase/response regulator CckA
LVINSAAITSASRWNEEGKRTRCLDEIQGNLGRMESLVSELVNFYNPRDMNMIPVDIHALLDKALSVSHFLLEQKAIEVERHYEAGPLMILGLTRNLIEAFINLISNACQAMAAGGRLRLQTRATLEPAQRQRLQGAGAGRLPAQYIMVKIEDNGCGIPEENRERIFRRFFTTRPEGHGLGLSAVQRIIKKNLGVIDFESTVGQGTAFYLYLPKA